jgi:hypothetical protein
MEGGALSSWLGARDFWPLLRVDFILGLAGPRFPISKESRIVGSWMQAYSGYIQGKFRVYSVENIQGIFRVHSENIQGTFRVHSGYIHDIFRAIHINIFKGNAARRGSLGARGYIQGILKENQ